MGYCLVLFVADVGVMMPSGAFVVSEDACLAEDREVEARSCFIQSRAESGVRLSEVMSEVL